MARFRPPGAPFGFDKDAKASFFENHEWNRFHSHDQARFQVNERKFESTG